MHPQKIEIAPLYERLVYGVMMDSYELLKLVREMDNKSVINISSIEQAKKFLTEIERLVRK